MHTPTLIVRLFTRAARIQRKRMILTITAIAWGTIAIVLLLSFGEGLKRSLTAGRRGLGENINIIWPSTTSKPFAGLPQGRPIRLIPEDVDLVLQNVPEITAATGEITDWSVLVSWGRVSLNKRITGVHVAYGDMRSHYPMPGGRFINEMDISLKRRVIFIGDQLKKDLFGEKEAVGETILLRNTPFTVIGVMQKKKQMGMYGGPDADHGIIPISTFEAIFGRRLLSNFVYKPVTLALAGAAKQRVMEVLGAKYRFDPTDTRALSMWDTVKDMAIIDNIGIGIQLFLGFIGTLTLIIGGVGVANIMYAAVTHRTREFGVQMALGAKRIYIMGALILEALVLTFAGGTVGIGVGVSIVEALAWLQSKAQSEAMQFLGAPTLSLPIALSTVALLGTIGLLAGYFPARRAVSVQPAVALRYE